MQFNAPQIEVPTPNFEFGFKNVTRPLVKKLVSFRKVYKYDKQLPAYHTFSEITFLTWHDTAFA